MIEIALALAVIGIAVVSILGLLTVGLNTSRDATDDNMAAQIIQAIIADRQSTAFLSATPAISETTFNIPALNSATLTTPGGYALYFRKAGGAPDITTHTYNQVKPGYYYEVDVARNNPAGAPPDLAVLDIKASWPANMTLTNRTSVFYSTAIVKK